MPRKPKPTKLGRPPSANPRTVKRPVLLTPAEAAAHDAARGDQPWGTWIRDLATTVVVSKIRDQAVNDDCVATIALCDLAAGIDPSPRLLERLHPEAISKMLSLSAGDALQMVLRDRGHDCANPNT